MSGPSPLDHFQPLGKDPVSALFSGQNQTYSQQYLMNSNAFSQASSRGSDVPLQSPGVFPLSSYPVCPQPNQSVVGFSYPATPGSPLTQTSASTYSQYMYVPPCTPCQHTPYLPTSPSVSSPPNMQDSYLLDPLFLQYLHIQQQQQMLLIQQQYQIPQALPQEKLQYSQLSYLQQLAQQQQQASQLKLSQSYLSPVHPVQSCIPQQSQLQLQSQPQPQPQSQIQMQMQIQTQTQMQPQPQPKPEKLQTQTKSEEVDCIRDEKKMNLFTFCANSYNVDVESPEEESCFSPSTQYSFSTSTPSPSPKEQVYVRKKKLETFRKKKSHRSFQRNVNYDRRGAAMFRPRDESGHFLPARKLQKTEVLGK